ncbi:hypothetical protein ACH4C6_32620 [Streptomyces sp. NPDC017943]|uniref:hypothetical protein n=1 Tax=Streptomyces sp. NPDC017943 TaxID=3365019 RepID=UPI0037B02AFC
MVPDLAPPEKSKAVRFGEVCGFRSSRVTESLSNFFLFATFEQEAGFPVGSYKSSAFEPVSMGVVGAPATQLFHPCPEFIGTAVDGGACEGAVPCGGTDSKIVARRAGVAGSIGARRTLSTGLPVQGRRMDEETGVLPVPVGVRFGVYTGPMTTLMASALVASIAPLGAVGR